MGGMKSIDSVMKSIGSIRSANERAGAILKRIADIPNPVVAEIGVFTGMLSMRLLRGHPGLHLFMVDSW